MQFFYKGGFLGGIPSSSCALDFIHKSNVKEKPFLKMGGNINKNLERIPIDRKVG
jgi:hypothetical protein